MTETTVDNIANYADGSGTYIITRVGDIMTTTIMNNGELSESFDMKLTRNVELDTANWEDWVLTEDFASDGDIMAVLIRGEGYTCEFI